VRDTKRSTRCTSFDFAQDERFVSGGRKRVAVLISGRGSNLKTLIDAEQDAYEIVLVASNVEDAPGLDFARWAFIPVFARSHKGL